MGYWGKTAENAYKILKDLLNVSEGTVSDLVLSYLNRGQERIWKERDWDILCKTSNLTLSSNAASLPADFGSIREVFTDVDGDGKPDVYYYLKGRPGVGYDLTTAFDKTTGHTWTIRFYAAPQGTVTVRYKAVLDDFTASYASEKTFFPESLLIAAAYLEYLEDTAVDVNLLNSQAAKYEAALSKFKEGYQDKNADMRSDVKDEYGNVIYTENFGLDGNYSDRTSSLQSASRSRFP